MRLALELVGGAIALSLAFGAGLAVGQWIIRWALAQDGFEVVLNRKRALGQGRYSVWKIARDGNPVPMPRRAPDEVK